MKQHPAKTGITLITWILAMHYAMLPPIVGIRNSDSLALTKNQKNGHTLNYQLNEENQ
jgi:hypothetical protein